MPDLMKLMSEVNTIFLEELSRLKTPEDDEKIRDLLEKKDRINAAICRAAQRREE
jgi:hypothetical protein